MIEFETDIDSNEILRSGRPIPGVYHCQIDQAIEHADVGKIELKCAILSPGSECGKTFYRNVYFRGADAEKTFKARKMALATAIRIGLTSQAAYDADRAANRSHGIEWTAAAGRQFIGELKLRQYDRDDGSRADAIDAEIYPIDHEVKGREVKAWDRELLSLVTAGGGNPFANQQASNQQPMQQRQQYQPPANAPAQVQQHHQPAAAATAQRSVYDDI